MADGAARARKGKHRPAPAAPASSHAILPAMYMRFFGLKQEPFSLAPDPRYLYMSKRHREALAHLLYGVGGGGGFVLLSGEIGAGKTTVCRCFLEQIPKRCNVAYIFNPKLTAFELVKTICEEFHIPEPPLLGGQPATVKTYVDALNEFLLKTHAVGQNNILIIDEAQMLSAEVLEQLRLLTNLETNERKLLQIVLIGQPELRTMLERPDLEQLAQRVIARFHLNALSAKETEHYIRHRLSVAGMTRAIPFDAKALQKIHELTRGVPRRINLLCDRVMLGAYAHGQHQIDIPMIEKAAREVFGRSTPAVSERSRLGNRLGVGIALAAALAVAVLLVIAVYGGWRQLAPSTALAQAGAASAPATGASAGRAATGATSAASTASHSGDATGTTDTRRATGTTGAIDRNAAASGTMSGVALTNSGATASAPSGAQGVAVATRPSSAAIGPATPIATAAATPLDAAALRARLKTFGRDERSGWRDLLPLWGVDARAGDPCAAAARHQIRCSKFAATLPMLTSLGRPGLVWLRDDDGRSTTALLVGLGPSTATLRSGEEMLSVQTAALAKAWRGEFGTAWRLPPGYVSAVAAGASGPLVDRLATQIASVAGEPAPPAGQTMDAGLLAKVGRFQAAHGLPAVGKAGPTTFMQLNRATGLDEPRLAGEPPQ
jgi:general secretion pathway protein A